LHRRPVCGNDAPAEAIRQRVADPHRQGRAEALWREQQPGRERRLAPVDLK
jgi:hypothetical protein